MGQACLGRRERCEYEDPGARQGGTAKRPEHRARGGRLRKAGHAGVTAGETSGRSLQRAATSTGSLTEPGSPLPPQGVDGPAASPHDASTGRSGAGACLRRETGAPPAPEGEAELACMPARLSCCPISRAVLLGSTLCDSTLLDLSLWLSSLFFDEALECCDRPPCVRPCCAPARLSLRSRDDNHDSLCLQPRATPSTPFRTAARQSRDEGRWPSSPT